MKTNINYKSDFKINETTERIALEVPFIFRYYVFDNKDYIASFDGTHYVNCERKEDGSLDVYFNNHGLGAGPLKVERKYFISDKAFADGVWDVVSIDYTDVRLTTGETDMVDVKTVVVPPYIKGDKGDPMTWETMTEEEREELVNGVAEAIDPEMVMTENEKARIEAENQRKSSETQRENTFKVLNEEMETSISESDAATKAAEKVVVEYDAKVLEQDEKLSELGQYVSNPEYVRAYTDADGRFLWGIKHDGSIEFAKGVPTPIKNYIVEFVINRLDNVIIPEIEALKEYHEQYLKEIENPEWARVIVDAEGKVLWGIRQDGSVEFTKGVPTSIKTYIDSLDRNNDEEVERINQLVIGLLADVKVLTDTYHYISNPEWACAIVDSEERILMGIKADGSYYIPNRDMYHVESNSEYAKVVVDADGRVVFGIKIDGSCYIPKGISEEAKKGLIELTSRISWFETEDIPEWLQVTTDSQGKILEGIGNDGKKYYPKQEMFEKTLDTESRFELTLDSEGHIISERDSKGKKKEYVGFETPLVETEMLLLGESGLSSLENILRARGRMSNVNDWSDEPSLHIEQPKCAIINFTGIESMPTSKTSNYKTYIQFWDMRGNYFRKEAIINAQGRSSMRFPKKNIGIDILNNNNWNEDDSFSLQIGDWVPQDSFHIKAFYTDPFKCICPIVYKLYDEVVKSRGVIQDYVWKRALNDVSAITSTNTGVSDIEDSMMQFPTGAKCFPDGFPCIVYLNGDFYGIFSWQLKKHRDNYHMKKNKAYHVHIDGVISDATLFKANGDGSKIYWTTSNPEGFEIRNPKGLVYAEPHNGTYKYDSDAPGGFEIAGNIDGSEDYQLWTNKSFAINEIVSHNGSLFINTIDGNDKEPKVDGDLNTDDNPDYKNKTNCGWINCTTTVKVKNIIISLSKVINILDTADEEYEQSLKQESDKEKFRSVFETYFDKDNLVDYTIVCDVVNNTDGQIQNCQWFTYNGVKWFIGIYDTDVCMGNWWEATQKIVEPATEHVLTKLMFKYIDKYYNDALINRYKELRNRRIIDRSHILSMVVDWLNRLGNKEIFEKEWAKWNGFIKNDSIMRLDRWLSESIDNMDNLYLYN